MINMDNNTPTKELNYRWMRYRELLHRYLPKADGAFVFSRVNIFYFTGTFANGVFWLPKEGEPILFCRRGAERAEIETPIKNIVPFNSYGDIEQTFIDSGTNLPSQTATEMNGLSWSLSKSLTKHLPIIKFLHGDNLIAMTRAKKSEWELKILREAITNV